MRSNEPSSDLALRPSSPGSSRARRRFAGAAGGTLVAALICLLHAAPGFAHHGPGAYDRAREVTVTGRVTRFEFVNPHVLIFIEVDGGEDGRTTEWAGELTSPNRLARMGGDVAWHKDILQPGDAVTLTGNPTHNGAPALLLNRVVDADGRVLTSSGR